MKMNSEEHRPFAITQDAKHRSALDGKWAVLNQHLQAARPDFQEPKVPYKRDVLI